MNKNRLPHGIKALAFAAFIVLVSIYASAQSYDQTAYSQYTASQAQQQQAPPQLMQQAQVTPAPQSASTYWTGNGGRGMNLGILLPQSQGLEENQAYLPAMVQGVLVSDVSKYSAISVLDRVSLDRVIAETLDPTYEDNWDIVRLGQVAHVENIMTGSIIRTATGFSLQINVTDTTANANTVASYSGTCTALELDDHSAIHRASLELLSQMNVQLNARARNELVRASSLETINAQTALAQGITAQRQGTEVEALSYFLQANSYDPELAEAESRLKIITASIANGNVGTNARNDIAWRRQWIERLQETEDFFSNYTQSQPYYLIYDPDIKHGTINYQNETIELSFWMGLAPDDVWVNSINQAITTVASSLRATGRAQTWGLDWPNNSVNFSSPFANRINNLTVVVDIINDQGKSIGRQTVNIPAGYNIYSKISRRITPIQWEGDVFFKAVDVNLISDQLTIQVTSIDGISGENVTRQKKINVMSNAEFFRNTGIRRGPVDKSHFIVRSN